MAEPWDSPGWNPQPINPPDVFPNHVEFTAAQVVGRGEFWAIGPKKVLYRLGFPRPDGSRPAVRVEQE